MCGDILVDFLNEKGDIIDLETTGFLSYAESAKSLTVQSFSLADAGTYNFKI